MTELVPQVKHDPIRLAVLVSGGGTTLKNFCEKIGRGELKAEVGLVIASNASAVKRLNEKLPGMDVKLVDRKSYASPSEFSDVVFGMIRQAEVDLVCLAGFLCLLVLPDDFIGRVLNIHPALLPSFGGHGMYGHHVHEAVLAYGCKISGCTVHFADQSYDTGPIIVQRCCAVNEGDTADTLASRVFVEECEAYPEAIRLISEGRVRLIDRHCEIT